MIVAIADTHTVIWYLFSDRRLGAAASAFIDKAAEDGEHIGVSAISIAEMVYLIEKGRIPMGTIQDLYAATRNPRAVLQHIPLGDEVAVSMSQIPGTKCQTCLTASLPQRQRF